VAAHLRLAERYGAELHFDEPALSWEARPDGVRVSTARGVYEASRLVVSVGPWAPEILADLGLQLVIERNVLVWFEPIGGREPFLPDRFPIYIWEVDDQAQFYGFPAQEGPPGGVKVALFRAGIHCTPETIDRTIHPHEIEELRSAIAERIPALNGALLDAATCMYTTAPDEHFVVGLHPRHDAVVIASPCSGHGYKFASVMGEVLADLAMHGTTSHPIALFDPQRFSRASQP
jgi:sarcosine oxidase